MVYTTLDSLVHTTRLEIDLFNEDDSAQADWWKVDKST